MKHYEQERILLLACGMQQDETERLREQYHLTYPVIYLERGMHERPEELHQRLQDLINENQDHDAILLTYGLCGRATEGLRSPHTRLVMPRFHDCIHQLLENNVDKHTLYLTRAWTLDEKSIQGQIQGICASYEPWQAREIISAIYGGYERIAVIDTDSYDTEPILAATRQTAAHLGMETCLVPSPCHVLRKLLTGEWDDQILVLQPGEAVRPEEFI